MDLQSDSIWLHFEDIGSGQAKCKLCAKTYSFKTSVANLRTHWERIHESSSSSSSTTIPTTTTAQTPHQLFVTSTTLTTDELLSKDLLEDDQTNSFNSPFLIISRLLLRHQSSGNVIRAFRHGHAEQVRSY